MKTVYGFDYSTGRFTGPVYLTDSDRSPLEPDVFLVPGNCTEVAPPDFDGVLQAPVWTGAAWQLVDVVPPAESFPADPEPAVVLTWQQRFARFLAENPDVAAGLAQGDPA